MSIWRWASSWSLALVMSPQEIWQVPLCCAVVVSATTPPSAHNACCASTRSAVASLYWAVDISDEVSPWWTMLGSRLSSWWILWKATIVCMKPCPRYIIRFKAALLDAYLVLFSFECRELPVLNHIWKDRSPPPPPPPPPIYTLIYTDYTITCYPKLEKS